MIKNECGNSCFPSMVMGLPNGTTVIGNHALDRSLKPEPTTIVDVQRMVAQRFETREIQKSRRLWQFSLEKVADD